MTYDLDIWLADSTALPRSVSNIKIAGQSSLSQDILTVAKSKPKLKTIDKQT